MLQDLQHQMCTNAFCEHPAQIMHLHDPLHCAKAADVRAHAQADTVLLLCQSSSNVPIQNIHMQKPVHNVKLCACGLHNPDSMEAVSIHIAQVLRPIPAFCEVCSRARRDDDWWA